jgi:hypothetical protein
MKSGSVREFINLLSAVVRGRSNTNAEPFPIPVGGGCKQGGLACESENWVNQLPPLSPLSLRRSKHKRGLSSEILNLCTKCYVSLHKFCAPLSVKFQWLLRTITISTYLTKKVLNPLIFFEKLFLIRNVSPSAQTLKYVLSLWLSLKFTFETNHLHTQGRRNYILCCSFTSSWKDTSLRHNEFTADI